MPTAVICSAISPRTLAAVPLNDSDRFIITQMIDQLKAIEGQLAALRQQLRSVRRRGVGA